MSDFPELESFEGGPEPLRAAYKRATAKVKELESGLGEKDTALKGYRLAEAGFPKGTPGWNLLNDLFVGDVTDAEAVKSFAEKYGHAPGAVAPSTEQPDPVTAGDQRLQGLRQSATPITPDTSQIAGLEVLRQKAESEGRITDAIALKDAIFKASGKWAAAKRA
jgi:hypothetical protein